jgi:tight adherence protein B
MIAGGLAAAWLAWLIQRALYLALQTHRATYTSQFEHSLRDLFLFLDLKLLWPAALLLGVIASGICVLSGLGLVAGLIAFALCWSAPNLIVAWLRRQRMKAFEQQLPDALLSLSAAMRAGSSLGNALQALVQHALPPLSQEFAVVGRQIRLGATAADAFDQLRSRLGGETLALLALTLRVALQTGGPLAAMLEQTAATLQDGAQVKSRLAALTAQGWLQAWVMGLMPVALMLALAAMDDNFAHALLHTAQGHAVLLALACFEALGFWWLRRTVVIRV